MGAPYIYDISHLRVEHKTSLFMEHIHSTPSIKRSESLINTSTPTLLYVLFRQSKMGQVVSAVPHEGGAHFASYSRLPETFTEIKLTKRQADSPSPSSPDDDRGGGEAGKN